MDSAVVAIAVLLCSVGALTLKRKRESNKDSEKN